jgi:hypothetical protein
MKKLHYGWDSNDLTYFMGCEKIRLILPINFVFKVLNTFYKYNPLQGYGEANLDVNTYAENKEIAEENIENSNNLLSFLYGLNITFGINGGFLSDNQQEPEFDQIIKGKNIKKIYDSSGTIKLLSGQKKKALFDSLACYSTGLNFDLERFIQESFLTRFRIFEIISFDFFYGLKANTLHVDLQVNDAEVKIKKIIDEHFHFQLIDATYKGITDYFFNYIVKRIKNEEYFKLSYIFNLYNIQYESSQLRELVTVRNNIIHAKGIIYNDDQKWQYSNLTDKLTKELISKYFFGKSYTQIMLDRKIIQYSSFLKRN